MPKLMNKTVLVTGSSGMIGTALVERLLNDGNKVYAVSRSPNHWVEKVEDCTIHTDLTDGYSALPEDVDTIVHLAAVSQIDALREDPTLAQANIEMTSTILEYAREIESNLLFASSREVYGDHDGTLRGEENVDIRAGRNPYAASKAAGEALIESYDTCYDNVRTCILRFTNIYGRYDASNRVIPIFIARASQNKKLVIHGEPMIRGFLYIDDCIEAIHRAIDSFEAVQGRVLNVGSGRVHSLLEVAGRVVESVNSDSEIIESENSDRTDDRYILDTSAIESTINWTPEHSLAAGIDATVKWYLNQEELLDMLLKKYIS